MSVRKATGTARARGPRQTSKCGCGCGQGAVGRSRKVTCPLQHFSAFVPRSAIEQGVGTCWCGDPLEPTCLNDRCYLPGPAGEAAMELASGILGGGKPDRKSGFGANGGQCRSCKKFTGKGPDACCPHCGFSRSGGYSTARGESLRPEMPF